MYKEQIDIEYLSAIHHISVNIKHLNTLFSSRQTTIYKHFKEVLYVWIRLFLQLRQDVLTIQRVKWLKYSVTLSPLVHKPTLFNAYRHKQYTMFNSYRISGTWYQQTDRRNDTKVFHTKVSKMECLPKLAINFALPL